MVRGCHRVPREKNTAASWYRPFSAIRDRV